MSYFQMQRLKRKRNKLNLSNRRNGRSRHFNSARGQQDMSTRRTYYWIYAPQSRGLYGPHTTYAEAMTRGNIELREPFKVIPLRTSDQSKASQLMKARRLHEGIGIKNALQRMRHTYRR